MVLHRERGRGGWLETGRPVWALSALKWLGAVAGVTGAILIALNIGGTIVGIGFVFFAVSALSIRLVHRGLRHGRSEGREGVFR